MKNGYLDFDEYIRQGDPQKKERAEAWRVAIGLQAVDGLKTSEYLHETARRNIEGEISIDEARNIVKQYYITKTSHDEDNRDQEEADIVSSNISKLLQTDAFTYSVAGISAIHKAIFEGVFKHVGHFREYDISKKEWVLRGDSVLYGRWQDIQMALEYDLEQERKFDYSSLNMGQIIERLAKFISGLWQIHPFREGNTRTTAVFAIKYLRSQGFQVNNDLFEQHSWYFRNALVRANYRNLSKGIAYESKFLIYFFRNLLLGENNVLRNRYMIINSTDSFEIPEQVPRNYPSTTHQLQDKFNTDNSNIIKLVSIIGKLELSVKEIKISIGLKDRKNISELYLNPAIQEGYVRRLYPDSVHHPRQKYLLTIKGLTLYN